MAELLQRQRDRIVEAVHRQRSGIHQAWWASDLRMTGTCADCSNRVEVVLKALAASKQDCSDGPEQR